MEHLALTIFLGVFTGLVTVTVVNLIKQFFSKVGVPWYEERIYKDVKIEGLWNAEATINGQPVTRVWELTRQAHKVSPQSRQRGASTKAKCLRCKVISRT